MLEITKTPRAPISESLSASSEGVAGLVGTCPSDLQERLAAVMRMSVGCRVFSATSGTESLLDFGVDGLRGVASGLRV